MLIPRGDRIAVPLAWALLAIATFAQQVMPSAHLGPWLTGRELALGAILAFVLDVLVIGILALVAGSRPARLFVASNAAVSITASIVGIASLSQVDTAK